MYEGTIVTHAQTATAQDLPGATRTHPPHPSIPPNAPTLNIRRAARLTKSPKTLTEHDWSTSVVAFELGAMVLTLMVPRMVHAPERPICWTAIRDPFLEATVALEFKLLPAVDAHCS